MECVLDCVLPYVHDGDDLNSISLVSRKFYDLDCITRKHLTIHVPYASNPSTLSKRFPSIESLALKGIAGSDNVHTLISATPWIKEISVKFDSLKALCIRHMLVSDHDLELLAKTRGKDLRTLKICWCGGFSEKGLLHISHHCNDLRSLCLEYDFSDCSQSGEWLRELALRNTPIQSLHFRWLFSYPFDAEDLTLFTRSCSNSLLSLKINPTPLNHLRDALSHAIKLQDFDGLLFPRDEDYTSFEFHPSIHALAIKNLPATSFSLLLPYANQLRELNLACTDVEEQCQCSVIERCPNLEVLCTHDLCGDMGLRVIGQVCKKLRKLIHIREVTHMGLIALVQGCTSLEYLDVTLLDISNEALECVATHLKNLRVFRMHLSKKAGISMTTDLPLDNGIRAMLKGCLNLKRLNLSLCDGGLTDVGFRYIGKYGYNLRNLFLSCKGVSVAGLLQLSKGCPKLRKLYLEDCPLSEQAVAAFVFDMHSLRYVWVDNGLGTHLALTRPTFTAEKGFEQD